jgi:hypothetical protein
LKILAETSKPWTFLAWNSLGNLLAISTGNLVFIYDKKGIQLEQVPLPGYFHCYEISWVYFC